jgi:hypothetical protein
MESPHPQKADIHQRTCLRLSEKHSRTIFEYGDNPKKMRHFQNREKIGRGNEEKEYIPMASIFL